MKTGEGKTLVSTLPVYLNALEGKGVHLVTVNDYLASRDAEWMGQIHRWLGLTVGLVMPGDVRLGPQEGAVRLRHHLRHQQRVRLRLPARQHGHEPRTSRSSGATTTPSSTRSTPSSSTRPAPRSSSRAGSADAAKLYYQFASIVRGLSRDVDYDVDEEKRTVAPTDDGIEKVEKALGVENLYDEVSTNLVHQFQAALKAKELYKRDKDYVVAARRGEDRRRVHRPHPRGPALVRGPAPGRRGQGGREDQGGEPDPRHHHPAELLPPLRQARRHDRHGRDRGRRAGQHLRPAGGADPDPPPAGPHRPARPHLQDRGRQVRRRGRGHRQERYETGQPVLVGTISVEKSEKLSRELDKRGVPHEVLNAKQHTREAEIVAQAGRLGAVTVATNMAGRGRRHPPRRQPRGPGPSRTCRPRGSTPTPTRARPAATSCSPSTRPTCEAEGDKVRELGGLYVLGTERHESRRIDNQLRGRSGRQGDPGESRFYLSLEDELMRLFATGAMNWVMGKALPDDVPIEARWSPRPSSGPRTPSSSATPRSARTCSSTTRS